MTLRTWKSYVTDEQLEECYQAAADFFESVEITDEGLGPLWPYVSGARTPSSWGGTADVVRAYSLIPQQHPDGFTGTKKWLLQTQVDDDGELKGAFRSTEFDFAGAEPTAWVLISLGEAGHFPNELHDAILFLDRCIDPSGGARTVPRDGLRPRTYTTALTLWAFSVWSHKPDLPANLIKVIQADITRLRLNLLECQAVDHGWGVNADARTEPASTAIVINALRRACDPEQKLPSELREAIRTLIQMQSRTSQSATGRRWQDNFDEWENPEGGRPVRCLHGSTSWALLALLGLDRRDARLASLRAARFLLDTQKGGSWRGNGTHQYVWLTSQSVIALRKWRAELPTSLDRESFLLDIYRIRRWFREHGVAVVLGGFLAGVYLPVATWVADAFNWLQPTEGDARAVLLGVISGLILTGIGSVGGILFSFFRGSRR